MNMRASGKNFSVHLNATKRLVMEKIQVELTTSDTNQIEPEPCKYIFFLKYINCKKSGVIASSFKFEFTPNRSFDAEINSH